MSFRTMVGSCLAVLGAAVSGACASADTGLPEAPDRRVPVRVDVGSGVETVDVVAEDQLARAWIEAAPDSAWPHLPDIFASLGFAAEHIEGMDHATRTLRAHRTDVRRLADRRPSIFLDCGRTVTEVRADNGMLEVVLTTRLTPSDGGTAVVTRIDAATTDVHSGRRVGCTSTGRLEALLTERLAAAPPPPVDPDPAPPLP